MQYKIMIVEDDQIISGVVTQTLEKWGYIVEKVTAFDEVLQFYEEKQPQLILMDITLPYFNGFHWCQAIRKISKVPIIFISSAKDNMNLIMAVNAGADDFIAKPFDLNVLVAKIQALLRRTYDFQGDSQLLTYEDLVLDLNSGNLIVGDSQVELTKNEYKIMHLLLSQPEKIISRETIMERLWDSDSFIDDNTLTVNMNRLRKKLREAGLSDYIKTKKGLGYLLWKG